LKKFIALLIVLSLSSPAFAQEQIKELKDEQDISVLNDELRKIRTEAKSIKASAGDTSYSDTRIAMLEGEHTLSDTGTQTITGAGFTPTWAVVIATENVPTAATGKSVGIYSGSTNYRCLVFADRWTAGASFPEGNFISIYKSNAPDRAQATCSFLSDGISLSWSITGAPTGTVYFYILVGR
jgi:hypothetical protein